MQSQHSSCSHEVWSRPTETPTHPGKSRIQTAEPPVIGGPAQSPERELKSVHSTHLQSTSRPLYAGVTVNRDTHNGDKRRSVSLIPTFIHK